MENFKVNDQVKIPGDGDIWVIVRVHEGQANLMNRKGQRLNRLLINLTKVY